MQSIPELWSQEALRELNISDKSHKEDRGRPEDASLTFTMEVLECDQENGREYLHILVTVSDTDRPKHSGGDSWTPLATSFLWYEDGELDMPIAKEIYESLRK